jgi:GNAT superfamily N-acetyltransferase
MGVRVRELGPEALSVIDQIPIRFRVESILRVEEADGGLRGLLLREEMVDEPYVKDYDEHEDEGARRWEKRFDVSNWGFFVAFDGDTPLGAATVAFRSSNVDMLEGRDDLAVLWDIRVRPDRRGEGVGSKLFQAAAGWARDRGCRQLKIETQNANVRACRFYASQGCHLGAIHRHAYRDPRVAHEVMLLWYLDL